MLMYNIPFSKKLRRGPLLLRDHTLLCIDEHAPSFSCNIKFEKNGEVRGGMGERRRRRRKCRKNRGRRGAYLLLLLPASTSLPCDPCSSHSFSLTNEISVKEI